MTTHPENKGNTETKIAKDELSEEQRAKASGGFSITKTVDAASPNFFQNCATGTPIKSTP